MNEVSFDRLPILMLVAYEVQTQETGYSISKSLRMYGDSHICFIAVTDYLPNY